MQAAKDGAVKAEGVMVGTAAVDALSAKVKAAQESRRPKLRRFRRSCGRQ